LHCQPGWADCDGLLDNGCETSLGTGANCGACGNVCPTCVAQTCCKATPAAACATATQLGSLALGQTITFSGNLPATALEDGGTAPNTNWLEVTFAGSNADPTYHPHVILTSDGGQFSFGVVTGCTATSGPIACMDNGPTFGLTEWEISNGSGYSPANMGAVPVPSAGTVFIQVVNGAGDCSNYTLKISD
jgi:hypothetical protein